MTQSTPEPPTDPQTAEARSADAGAAAARRDQDRAIAVPLLGVFVLIAVPAALFGGRNAVFGLPAIWAFLFCAWLAMILAAAWMSLWRARREAAQAAAKDASTTGGAGP